MINLRDKVIREITVAPGWNIEDATVLVDAMLAEAVTAALDALAAKVAGLRKGRVGTVHPYDRGMVDAATAVLDAIKEAKAYREDTDG